MREYVAWNQCNQSTVGAGHTDSTPGAGRRVHQASSASLRNGEEANVVGGMRNAAVLGDGQALNSQVSQIGERH